MPSAPRPTDLRKADARKGGFFWDLLTFERLVTGEVIHLVYWAGLGVIALFGFSVVGAAVGLAVKEPGFSSLLLAFPVLVAGLLAAGAMTLLWRAMCEFYVAVFRISDDLRSLRQSEEAAARRVRLSPQATAVAEDGSPI